MSISPERIKTIIDTTNYKIKTDTERKKLIEKNINNLTVRLTDIDKAIGILVAVLSITQESIKTFIEDTVSMTLQYVYDNTYSFKIQFELKRNQPEVLLIPVKDDLEYDPKMSCGIGVIDVCSFALRIACWALLENKTLPILIFDEPFRNLHGEKENIHVGKMIKKLSETFGLQIIIVSGESVIGEYADKIIDIKFLNGKSVIG